MSDERNFDFIPDKKLISDEYYINKLSLALQNSYGISEHLKIFSKTLSNIYGWYVNSFWKEYDIFNYNENNVKDDIIKNVKNTTYNTKLGEVLSAGEIMSAVMRADKPVNGVSTFFVTSCVIGDDRKANYVAKDTYYEYTNFQFVLGSDNKTVTLTIN